MLIFTKKLVARLGFAFGFLLATCQKNFFKSLFTVEQNIFVCSAKHHIVFAKCYSNSANTVILLSRSSSHDCHYFARLLFGSDPLALSPINLIGVLIKNTILLRSYNVFTPHLSPWIASRFIIGTFRGLLSFQFLNIFDDGLLVLNPNGILVQNKYIPRNAEVITWDYSINFMSSLNEASLFTLNKSVSIDKLINVLHSSNFAKYFPKLDESSFSHEKTLCILVSSKCLNHEYIIDESIVCNEDYFSVCVPHPRKNKSFPSESVANLVEVSCVSLESWLLNIILSRKVYIIIGISSTVLLLLEFMVRLPCPHGLTLLVSIDNSKLHTDFDKREAEHFIGAIDSYIPILADKKVKIIFA